MSTHTIGDYQKMRCLNFSLVLVVAGVVSSASALIFRKVASAGAGAIRADDFTTAVAEALRRDLQRRPMLIHMTEYNTHHSVEESVAHWLGRMGGFWPMFSASLVKLSAAKGDTEEERMAHCLNVHHGRFAGTSTNIGLIFDPQKVEAVHVTGVGTTVTDLCFPNPLGPAGKSTARDIFSEGLRIMFSGPQARKEIPEASVDMILDKIRFVLKYMSLLSAAEEAEKTISRADKDEKTVEKEVNRVMDSVRKKLKETEVFDLWKVFQPWDYSEKKTGPGSRNWWIEKGLVALPDDDRKSVHARYTSYGEGPDVDPARTFVRRNDAKEITRVTLDQALDETLQRSCEKVNETVFSADLRSDALVAVAVLENAMASQSARVAMLAERLDKPVVVLTNEKVGRGYRIVAVREWAEVSPKRFKAMAGAAA